MFQNRLKKLAIDSIALQNRQKEKKTVLEQKQKEYQTTDSAEKEKAETDFRKEKIDTLYAGVYKELRKSWVSSDKNQ